MSDTLLASEIESTEPRSQQPPELHVHVIPPRVLLSVFAVLIGLTVLTVVAASFQTGRWEIWISMGIASAKALLVALYFMHLRYDKPFYAITFATAVLCLALFLGLTLADVEEYRDDIIPQPNVAAEADH